MPFLQPAALPLHRVPSKKSALQKDHAPVDFNEFNPFSKFQHDLTLSF
jgi:hypothetical protein